MSDISAAICSSASRRPISRPQVTISSQLILTPTTYPKNKARTEALWEAARTLVVTHMTSKGGSRLWHGLFGATDCLFKSGSGSKAEPCARELQTFVDECKCDITSTILLSRPATAVYDCNYLHIDSATTEEHTSRHVSGTFNLSPLPGTSFLSRPFFDRALGPVLS
jgi:hypothetical protein